jgi:hypothetical protein
MSANVPEPGAVVMLLGFVGMALLVAKKSLIFRV